MTALTRWNPFGLVRTDPYRELTNLEERLTRMFSDSRSICWRPGIVGRGSLRSARGCL